LLNKLLRHGWIHSPFYRELWSNYGIKENALSELAIRDLPFVSKQLLMDNFDAVVTDSRLRKHEIEQWIQNNPDPRANYRNEFIIVHSSGSSGDIGIYAYDRRAWDLANATIASCLSPLRRNHPSDRTRVAIYLASHGHFAGISTAVRMPADTYDLQIYSVLEGTDHVVQQLNAFQPHRIGGYSSSVATLAELALQSRLRISPETILVSGDKLTSDMEQSIQAAWNAAVYVLYSASESLCIAIKPPGSEEMTVLDDLNLLEVLNNRDEEVLPGDTGRAVLTNLYNYTFPMIRYELGDYLTTGSSVKGNPSVAKSLRDIQGRLRDALPVVLEDGKQDTIHPIVLAEFFVPGVTRIQFRSLRPDHVLINYVAGIDVDALIQKEFQRILEIKVATRTRVAIQRKQHIPNDPRTGKFELVKIEHSEPHPGSQSITIQACTEAFATPILRNPPSAFSQFGNDELERSVIDVFERQVVRHSDRVAIKTETRQLSYKDLNVVANRVARAIIEKRGEGEEPIALLLENGAPIMAAIFGVLKAGKPYMPLDPSYPQPRIRAMLEDSQAGLIVTSGRHVALANESAGSRVQVMNVDNLDPSLSGENLQLPVSADTLACILYTSGSTGEPKGVLHNHRNILHKTMEYTNALHLCASDKIALLSPCTFSLSVGFIFGALLNGACLYPIDVKGEGLTNLANRLAREEITVYNSVPTVFRNFTDNLFQKEALPNLRLLHLGGEPVTAKDVDRYKKHFSPDCVLLHHLGSNETGTIAQFFITKTTSVHGNLAPAGHPPEDTRLLILDEDGNRLGFNRVGEIAVQSRYLAVGYWRKPEMTRAAFLQDPAGGDERIYRTGDLGLLRPDGSLEHYGRKDFQVKIRGQRVQVVEIDMALSKHGAVKEAVTVARDDALGDKCLVSYVVPATVPAPTSRELRLFLQQHLPDYMVPSSVVFLDAMPLTPNGKLDRQALPVPRESSSDGQFVAPHNPVEEQIANIWCEVLRLDRVGTHDDFFDLGGHSLKVAEVLSRLRDIFGVDVPFAAFLAEPTVAGMAAVVVRYQGDEGVDDEVRDAFEEVEQCSEEEAQRLLAQQLGKARS
jgi:amino acid adenylation domain-containing protein